MIRASLISTAVVLFAQADPRIVRTTAPAECQSPDSFPIHARNYPRPLRQLQEIDVECIASRTDDSTTRRFGAATFCGSDDNGTEQKWYLVNLGVPSPDAKRALESFSCPYPSEMRIVPPARSAEETAPETERMSRSQAGMFANVPSRGDGEWQSILENEHIAVAVQRQLYYENFGFRVRVRVSNKTNRTLGFDLRRRDRIIYPNLWEFHRAAERPLIEEIRGSPIGLSPALVAKAIADFRAGALTALKESVDYYCGFRGRSPSGGDYSGERNLTISMDGQLIFTDGRVASSLDLQWREGLGPRQTDLVIPVPFQLLSPPRGATVF